MIRFLVTRMTVSAFGLLCIGGTLMVPDARCAPVVYQDENGYFTLTVPDGWKLEDYSAEARSKAQLRSPDGKAVVGIIAGLDGGNIGNLFLIKKDFVEDHRARFPDGRFSLSREMLCDLEVVRVGYAIPKVLEEEFYYCFADGVRYDLVYGAGSAADFKHYKKTALKIFCSLKLERRTQETP
ncbi:MAG: hypothetical protein ABH865_00145 [Candidatus Omnitrophota bacterium]|nr:hypothetical protein [Candidatus Omnitrophota bacterium]